MCSSSCAGVRIAGHSLTVSMMIAFASSLTSIDFAVALACPISIFARLCFQSHSRSFESLRLKARKASCLAVSLRFILGYLGKVADLKLFIFPRAPAKGVEA